MNRLKGLLTGIAFGLVYLTGEIHCPLVSDLEDKCRGYSGAQEFICNFNGKDKFVLPCTPEGLKVFDSYSAYQNYVHKLIFKK